MSVNNKLIKKNKIKIAFFFGFNKFLKNQTSSICFASHCKLNIFRIMSLISKKYLFITVFTEVLSDEKSE